MGGDDRGAHEVGLDRVVRNPFYVLGLTPSALDSDISVRHGSLDAKLRGGRPLPYQTPLGPRTLDSELLDWAIRELRDPDRRLVHELRYVPLPTPRSGLRVVASTPKESSKR